MKVLGYYPLHYGAEYLRASISSLIDQVDKLVFLYTPTGSYGHQSAGCPESEHELKQIAMSFPKTEWISGTYHHEGEHRDTIFKMSQGYDLVLACDADEVFDPVSLKSSLEHAMNSRERNFGVNGYVNFFRSFDQVVEDSFRPVRIINPNRNNKDQGEIKMTVYHFGCCQSEDIMRYKWEVHGHKAEIRERWLEDVYLNPQCVSYMHPASLQIWDKLIPFDKNTLPDVLKNHPNFNRRFV